MFEAGAHTWQSSMATGVAEGKLNATVTSMLLSIVESIDDQQSPNAYLIEPVANKSSAADLRYYKMYELHFSDDKHTKNLTFSCEVPDTGESQKNAQEVDDEMMRDVLNFVTKYTKGNETSMLVAAKSGHQCVTHNEIGHVVTMGAYAGAGSRYHNKNRRGGFLGYEAFFREFLPDDRGGGVNRATRSYKNDDWETTCSRLAPRYTKRQYYENGDYIDRCNSICGIICRGAVVHSPDKSSTLMVKQVVGVEGSWHRVKGEPWESTPNESIGVESFLHSISGGIGHTATTTEVRLPKYARHGAARDVRWYAIAERCLRHQHAHMKNHLHVPYSQNAPTLSVMRPSNSLLYAVVTSFWKEHGNSAPVQCITYYTLGASRVPHKQPPPHEPKQQQQQQRHTGTHHAPPRPMYKILYGINEFYNKKSPWNPDLNSRENYPDLSSQERRVEKRGANNQASRRTPPQPQGGGGNSDNRRSVVGGKNTPRGARPQSGKTYFSNRGSDRAKRVQAASTKRVSYVDSAQHRTRPQNTPVRQTAPIAAAVSGGGGGGIGHEATVLAVEAMMTLRKRAPATTNNIASHASIAAACAAHMGLLA
jgi:hypothetical protein